jgi:hypothetical protein
MNVTTRVELHRKQRHATGFAGYMKFWADAEGWSGLRLKLR